MSTTSHHQLHDANYYLGLESHFGARNYAPLATVLRERGAEA